MKPLTFAEKRESHLTDLRRLLDALLDLASDPAWCNEGAREYRNLREAVDARLAAIRRLNDAEGAS